MIFTRDFVTRDNHWPITPLVTKKSLFTVTHALFFISYTKNEDRMRARDNCIEVLSIPHLYCNNLYTSKFTGRFNIKVQSYRCKDTWVSWRSYLYNGDLLAEETLCIENDLTRTPRIVHLYPYCQLTLYTLTGGNLVGVFCNIQHWSAMIQAHTLYGYLIHRNMYFSVRYDKWCH